MPIPTPGANEPKKKFIDRCMSNEVMVTDYPDNMQRSAVCYDSWGKAHMAAAHELTVEIFAVGTWNGIEFTKEDLNQIAANFHSLLEYHRVPLKFGHNDQQQMTDGHPALGWVTDVWVSGTKLLAKFSDVPDIVYNAMEKRLYRNVSIELDMGVEHKGNHYSFVLSGVALLGADIPAVNTIADLQTYMERDELSFSKRVEFTAIQGKPERSNSMADETVTQELETLKLKYTALEKERDKLVDENNELKTERTQKRAEFAALEAAEKARKEKEERKSIETRLDTLVKEKKITPFMRDDFLADYDQAEEKKVIVYTIDKMEKTINSNPAYFGAEQARAKHEREESESELSAGEVVVQRTNEYMAKHGEKSFVAAKTAVLRADPELADRYTKGE